MAKSTVHDIFKVLLQLLDQKDWETRHGGILGIKYMFAVRQASAFILRITKLRVLIATSANLSFV